MKRTWFISLIMLNLSILDARSPDMMRERKEVPQNERWNVEALYPALTDWKKEFDAVKGSEGQPSDWPNLKAFEGKLKDPESTGGFFRRLFQTGPQAIETLYLRPFEAG